MMLGRLNVQSAGHWVLQDFDTNNIFGVAYNEGANPAKPRPINYGARYETVLVAGVPRFRRVASTSGPIGGSLCLPPKAPRILAQWALGCVPAKITTASPLKATPVRTGNGSGWTAATDLDEIACYTSDGSAPAVDTFGLLVLGTELGAQNPLFFQGGSGGASLGTYRVTGNNTDGTYTLQQYDYKNGALVGAAVLLCEELNLSPNVPVSHWVFGKVEADGVVRFEAPFGSC